MTAMKWKKRKRRRMNCINRLTKHLKKPNSILKSKSKFNKVNCRVGDIQIRQFQRYELSATSTKYFSTNLPVSVQNLTIYNLKNSLVLTKLLFLMLRIHYKLLPHSENSLQPSSRSNFFSNNLFYQQKILAYKILLKPKSSNLTALTENSRKGLSLQLSKNIYSFFILFIQLCLINHLTGTANGIGCFVCSSVNGTNAECEDTFNSTVKRISARGSVGIYQFPCWSFKKNRQGLFPADHCIKVSGYQTENPAQTMIIRTCALDSGTLTADTEIVRVSHCGHFKYEGSQYTGCVQACDTDGCNGAHLKASSLSIQSLTSAFVLAICLLF